MYIEYLDFDSHVDNRTYLQTNMQRQIKMSHHDNTQASNPTVNREDDLSDWEVDFIAKHGREALLAQYDAIVRFRDDIFAGRHPRFKRDATVSSTKQLNLNRVLTK